MHANDKLVFKVNDASTMRVATFAAGNYSVKDFGLAVVAAMNATSGAEYFESGYLTTTNARKIKQKTTYTNIPFTIFADDTLKTMWSP